jgi:hypothetical protein
MSVPFTVSNYCKKAKKIWTSRAKQHTCAAVGGNIIETLQSVFI